MRPTVTTGAILFTDMVASTALRSRLGEERAERLRKDHDEIVATAVAAHRGEILRWTGDGVKAAFGTASDAVSAAIDVRRAVSEYVGSSRAVAAFQLRTGLAAGDVLVDDGDHHGITVIEAARLEALAAPGEILATDSVKVLARRRADVTFEAVGERTLKGLDEPVGVHRVVDLKAGSLPEPPRWLTADASPLVGRDDQLTALAAAWAASQAGGARVVTVTGLPGHGKSRVLGEAAATAHRQGGLVLAGRCSAGRSIPYEPFVEALRAVTSLDTDLQRALTDPGAPLARLFLDSVAGGTDAQPASARLDLFDAVVSLVRRLSRLHPVAVVIDDLHHAGESTVRLLRHVIDALADERLLVVAGHDVERGVGADSAALIAELDALPTAVSLHLPALRDTDVIQLVRQRAHDLPARRVVEVADELLVATGGTPLFIDALVDHVLAGGAVSVDKRVLAPVSATADDRSTVPTSVHDAVLRRIDVLDGTTAGILTTAAVVGEVFDVTVLAEVAHESIDRVLDVLDDLARHGLLVETDVGRFGFAQSIVRTCLVERLGATRRAVIHRRVAEAFEAHEPDQFDEIARHWAAAGEEERMIVHLTRAARRDLVALAFESAHERFHELVDIISRDPAIDVRTRASAWLGLGAAGRATGDASYTAAIIRAARLGLSIGDHDIVAEAAALSTWPGTFFFIAENPEIELIELCERALDTIDRADPVRVRVLASLASHLTFGAERERRRALIDEALSLAPLHTDPLLLATVLHAEFLCLWEPATLERREEIARDLGRIARATGDAEVEFLSAFFTSYCTAERGELGRARDAWGDVHRLAVASRNPYFEFLAERFALSIDIVRCEPDTAPRIDALAVAYHNTIADTDGTWALQTGYLALRSGTLGDMVNAMQAMTTGNQARTWIAALALARLHAGDHEAARALLVEQGDVSKNYFWLTVAQVQATVAAEVGALDHCRRLVDEIAPYRGRLGITASGSLCLGLVSRSIGELLLALGDHDAAVEMLVEALEHAEREGMLFEAVMCRRLLAAAWQPSRPGDASALAASAASEALRHGFRREHALLADLVG